MRKGGGKQKGASFERQVCRLLSLWVSNGTQEDCFWRSAMSGGRSTVAHAKGKRLAAQAGDISCIHPIGHALTNLFIIECKTYRDLQFEGLLKGTGTLCKFWDVLNREARKYGKLPLLIAKQNQQPSIVCVDRKGLDILVLRLKCSLTAPKLNFYAILLDEFLKMAKPPGVGETHG